MRFARGGISGPRMPAALEDTVETGAQELSLFHAASKLVIVRGGIKPTDHPPRDGNGVALPVVGGNQLTVTPATRALTNGSRSWFALPCLRPAAWRRLLIADRAQFPRVCRTFLAPTKDIAPFSASE